MNAITLSGATAPRRWMLVDDDPQVLKLMRLSLGYFRDAEICCCSGLSEALNLFATAPQSFQLVITDFNFGPNNCLAMCDQMRSLAPGVKIVLITGDLNGISHKEAREFGFITTLFKPFSVATLRSTVRAVMQHGSHDALPSAKGGDDWYAEPLFKEH